MPSKKPFIASYDMEEISTGVPFAIEYIQNIKEEDDRLFHAHRHNFYTIGFSTKGNGFHMVDFERVSWKARDLIMIVPGQIHEPMPISDSSGWLIAFGAEFLAGHSIHLPLAPIGTASLPAEDFAQAEMLVKLMEKECKEHAPNYIALVQHYLAALLLIMQRNLCNTIEKPGPALIHRYRELLETNYLQWTKPAQYATALHISADHLNEVVKQHTGQTASSLITERRILEAKRLLLHAKETIKEIAWHLQFNEVSYFNRFFKQHTGYTPASFREAVREKYSSIPE